MRQKQRKYRDCHSQQSLHVPNRTVSLRTILDRASAGLPINASVTQHVPLPPDGEDLEDFDTGTEEYTDIVDVQQLDERIKERVKAAKEKQAADKKKAEEDAFNAKVEEEIAKRAAAEQQN